MESNDLLKKRIKELSLRAYEKGYHTFTEFLNMDEISVLLTTSKDNEYRLYGGYDGAERCVAGFGADICNNEYPIACIKIEPIQQKFADKLGHRDFLGSLMNLGINRNTLGDIVINDNIGYLFCLNTMSEYIVNNLNKVKHTSVICSLTKEVPEFLLKKPESTEIIISSTRVDVVAAAVYHLSRNTVTQLINREQIFINSKIAYKESLILKEGDTVSVRGHGKFIYNGVLRQTKKGKAVAEIKIYT